PPPPPPVAPTPEYGPDSFGTSGARAAGATQATGVGYGTGVPHGAGVPSPGRSGAAPTEHAALPPLAAQVTTHARPTPVETVAAEIIDVTEVGAETYER